MSISSIRLEVPAYQIPKRALLSSRVTAISVGFVNRAIDLCFASVGLVFGAPVFALIALAIRLDSPGPILYRQLRASALRGLDARGRPVFGEFRMIKFRSMRVDAEVGRGAV